MKTIISAFEDRAAAERAVERLVDAGFDRDAIHVQEGVASFGLSGASTTTTPTGQDEGVMGSIRHFFASLFGDDSPAGAGSRYSEAVHRGHPVVVMDALDEVQADRASAILHELGAFDVDERAAQWGAGAEPMAASRAQAGDVVHDELEAGQRAMDRGRVRVFQRESEQPVSELVKLHQDRAAMARRALDPQDRTETITDSVRRKDVDVERIEGERERAVASDRTLTDKTLREGGLESRDTRDDTRDIAKKRDI